MPISLESLCVIRHKLLFLGLNGKYTLINQLVHYTPHDLSLVVLKTALGDRYLFDAHFMDTEPESENLKRWFSFFLMERGNLSDSGDCMPKHYIILLIIMS